MTTALVTGGNKGIGYAICEGLGALGWSVGVGARDEARRTRAVEQLRAAGIDAFGVPLDVTSDESVVAAAALLTERGGLDVLVNNAAVTGGMPQSPTLVSPAAVLEVANTNVVGVIRVTNAVLPLLRRSEHPRIVMVSSSVGSLTMQTASKDAVGPVSGAYSPSKTYLNAVTIQYVKDLDGSGILVNMGCPGYVKTDLNGQSGHRTPEEGARTMVRLATLPDDGPTGTYSNDEGPLPW